ncbi:hypothetical protein CAEBREN_05811 [Caenorhabditis brenneri]|uniref:Uncharacterized protein n=1 Tax=Caenorhabditis brenneri TaxID=135651 RepID=G0MMS2_CAEBE|nr:hypothetical protein CAEBREN_05811 [Caenorhabditis brenneri]
MAENKYQDGRHHSDDPTTIEELVRQVVASATPYPNLPPLPYSLQKMKNVVMQLTSFTGPRSYDWRTEPGLTPLQIEALSEIERLFLESRAFHKLLHGIYATWREHQVEPRPSEGTFFKAVAQREQQPFHNSNPVFKVFWGSHEGYITWSGQDVIPVMREIVNNLIRREAVVPPIPAEVVIVGNEVVVAADEEVRMVLEEAIKNNLVFDEPVEDSEPNGAAAEVFKFEDEAHVRTGADTSGSDVTGNKENQPVSNPVEQADCVKPISESFVGTRSLSSTNLVGDTATASMLPAVSDLGSTNDVPAAPPQGESNSSCKTNFILNAGTSDNVETSVATSSKNSIPTTLSSMGEIEEEHSAAQNGTDDVVLADTIPVLISSIDLAVDHEEEVETTTFEISAESSRKRRVRKRFSKLRLGTPDRPRQAKTAKVDSRTTDKDEDDSQNIPIPVDLANQDGSEIAVPMDEPSAEPDIPENLGVESAGSQSLLGVKTPQCSRKEEEEVIADTISDLVNNLIDLVVNNEENAEKLAARSQNDEDQLIVEEVQLDEPSAQLAEAQIVHQMFDGTEFDVPESYATALIPSSVELAPLRRRFVPRPAPPLTSPFFVIRNVREMNKEKRRALKSFANQPPIRPGTVEYKELLDHAQIVFDNSGFMEEDYLLTIMPFLRKHFCDPYEKLEGDFPKTKIIVPPSVRKMCLEWIRVVIGGCKNRFSDLFTQWQEHKTDFYLEWVRLKKIVDELIFQQVQCRLITGEVGDRARMKKKRSEEAVVVDMEKDEPPPKRQCFWMS